MRVAVLGGAGYVGSHAARAMVQAGHEVTVIDDLSSGHAAAVRSCALVQADIRDREAILRVLIAGRFDAVAHFAARAIVAESFEDPAGYHATNVAGFANVLDAMRAAEVRCLVLSSSAAVYGLPVAVPLGEAHRCEPVSPYGRTKLLAEGLAEQAAQAGGPAVVILRYFNAAGAAADGLLGESHRPETHLLPRAISAALGTAPALALYGTDHPTADGTCVRDFVHVEDLADAHVAAIDHCARAPGAHVFNLGSGRGASVREVVECVGHLAGTPVPFRVEGRREGDPATLVADITAARDSLGWAALRSELETIVESALRWHRNPAF